MRSWQVLLLALFAYSPSWAISNPTNLPLLPEAYTTKIQANVKLNERGKAGMGIAGVSYAFDEAVWGTERASLRYKVDNENMRLYGRVIWNPDINGVNSFIDIQDFMGIHCYADTMKDNPILGALFDRIGNTFPSISHMLHFGAEDGYNFNGTTSVNGIPVNVYVSEKVSVPAINGTFHVKYYWTVGEEWAGTAGINHTIPVEAQVNGEYWFLDKWHTADMYFEFVDFKEDPPSPDEFYPPADLSCEGRSMEIDLPKVPEFFSYTDEALFLFELPISDNGVRFAEILSTTNENYDYLQKVSRSDYRTINLADLEKRGTYVNEIKDFRSNVMYRIWADYGNCTIDYVGHDMISDVNVNPDGTVTMTRPFEMFGLDKKFAYNGRVWKERGISMDSYVTQIEKTYEIDGSKNMTLALWLSGGEIQVEGDSTMEYKVPTKIETYPTNDYLDVRKRRMHNIVGFRTGEPDFRLFDITPCFLDYQMSHRMIKTVWQDDFIVDSNLKSVQDRIRSAIMNAAKVTPLRVQNIQVYEEPENMLLYIVFTLVDFPREHISGVNVSTLPPEVTLALPSVVENLQTVIQNNELKIELPKKDGTFAAVMAAPDYFQEVDRPSNSGNNGGGGDVVIDNSGFSGGAMAGLAFGMIALGLVMGGVVYFFVLRSKARSQFPTVRGFDNPLHGSVNLAES